MPEYRVEYRAIPYGEGHLPRRCHQPQFTRIQCQDAGHAFQQIVDECRQNNATAVDVFIEPAFPQPEDQPC